MNSCLAGAAWSYTLVRAYPGRFPEHAFRGEFLDGAYAIEATCHAAVVSGFF